jgi:hypothetical protein
LEVTIEGPHSFGKGFMKLKKFVRGVETYTWGWEEDHILA